MVERSKCMNVPELRFKGFKQEWDFCSVGDFYYFKNGLNKGKEFFGYGTPIVNFTDVFNNRGLTSDILKGRVSLSKYNPQNEMFRLLGTKRSFSQNETFFFSHP